MWLLLIWPAAGAVLLSSCSSVERTIIVPPAIAGATFVGNKTCYDCHTNITRVFSASVHSRLHLESTSVGKTGCEACHGPGSLHVAAGGGRGRFIVNPGRDPAPCLRCHVETEAEVNLPQHHPIREGKMNCVQCHDPHGMDIYKKAGGLMIARQNEGCAECHREQVRPYVFVHEALREGCVTCHQPHGSINAKMLVQRDNNLCLRCHAQIAGPGSPPGTIFIGKEDHTPLLNLGNCWNSGCHTAIHGSNVDPKLRF